MTGKIAILAIVLTALIAGGLMYYLQVYAYYDRLSAPASGEVLMTSVVTGQPEPVAFSGYEGIDSDSSPIRYRACFDLSASQAMLTETFVLYDRAEPLVAPGWFDCFDATRIGRDLETGEALAFLGQENITYGVDRVVAVMSDGRAFAWNQINRCGEVVFDGDPAPEGCPPPPESLN